MIGRILALAAATAAAASVPLAPVQAEFFTLAELRDMCRGAIGENAEFRTGAGHRLLAETYRARCRMYLLGVADGYLQTHAETDARMACIRPGTPEAEVAEPLIEAVLTRTDVPDDGIAALVREVLRSRFGCA